jgi:hypothetical protein
MPFFARVDFSEPSIKKENGSGMGTVGETTPSRGEKEFFVGDGTNKLGKLS